MGLYREFSVDMPCGWIVVYQCIPDENGQPDADTLACMDEDRRTHSEANPKHDPDWCRERMSQRGQ